MIKKLPFQTRWFYGWFILLAVVLCDCLTAPGHSTGLLSGCSTHAYKHATLEITLMAGFSVLCSIHTRLSVLQSLVDRPGQGCCALLNVPAAQITCHSTHIPFSSLLSSKGFNIFLDDLIASIGISRAGRTNKQTPLATKNLLEVTDAAALCFPFY